MRSGRKGFSLVEISLALGISAFVLVAIFALLPIGISNQQASLQQTAAVNLATALVNDLNQVPSALAIRDSNGVLSPISARYGIDVTQPSTVLALDEAGNLAPNFDTARYKTVISLTLPPADAPRSATYGSIRIEGWPSGASSPLGSVTVFIALDRN